MTAGTLAGQAAEFLREAILRGEIASGAPLREQTACGLTGMSRTPVRTALNTLANEGLLEYLPQRGYRVRPFDLAAVVQAYEARAVLEGLACRLLGEAGMDADTGRILARCVADGHRLIERAAEDGFDRRDWGAMNLKFHRAILNAAGSALLSELVERAQRVPLSTLTVIPHWRGPDSLEKIRWSHVDHVYILDALERGQGARAEARMREHIEVGGYVIREQIEDALENGTPIFEVAGALPDAVEPGRPRRSSGETG
jgi:GntR family transcriptional regulator, vanillate catabolism transcriptional regulator